MWAPHVDRDLDSGHWYALRSRIGDWRQHHRHQQQQLESSSRVRRGCTVVVVVTVFVIVAVQPHMT